jgi:predicted TIM-barrel fold metal-dependent hydrolase
MSGNMTDRHHIGRRSLLAGAGLAALAATGAMRAGEGRAQENQAVPNSAGTELPKLKAPAGACDCHHHIYDTARFPVKAGLQVVPNARVEEYRLLQRRLGISRDIVVTPTPYPATLADNQVTLDAIARFGANARGVAIVSADMSDADLKTLDAGGIRGIRYSLTSGRPGAASTASYDAIEAMAKRVAPLGWHVQFNVTAEQVVAAEAMLNRLATPIVFDHMGHLTPPEGIAHPAFGIIHRLIDKGRTWVKLSGAYQDTKVGPPTYADATPIAQAYVKAAPERMVWGSDWPHPTEKDKPNDAILFDLLAQWVPDEATRNRILVQNPEALYGFGKSA